MHQQLPGSFAAASQHHEARIGRLRGPRTPRGPDRHHDHRHFQLGEQPVASAPRRRRTVWMCSARNTTLRRLRFNGVPLLSYH